MVAASHTNFSIIIALPQDIIFLNKYDYETAMGFSEMDSFTKCTFWNFQGLFYLNYNIGVAFLSVDTLLNDKLVFCFKFQSYFCPCKFDCHHLSEHFFSSSEGQFPKDKQV